MENFDWTSFTKRIAIRSSLSQIYDAWTKASELEKWFLKTVSSKQYVCLGCSNGWTFYLTNLKSVYEGGLDLRNKDEKLSAMINN